MPKLKTTVNMKGFDDIARDMDALSSRQLEYGIIEDIPYPSGDTNVASVGFWNDRGTKDASGNTIIPARPWLTDTGTVSFFEMSDWTRHLMWNVGRGKSKTIKSLDFIGNELIDLTRTQIADGVYRALSPATVSAKGSDVILIESGLLFDSIDYKVTTGRLGE